MGGLRSINLGKICGAILDLEGTWGRVGSILELFAVSLEFGWVPKRRVEHGGRWTGMVCFGFRNMVGSRVSTVIWELPGGK